MTKEYEVIVDENTNRLLIKGRITFSNAAAVFKEAKLGVQRLPNIIVDMSGLVTADSSCLALLTAIIRLSKQQTKSVAIANMPQFLSDLGRVSGLDDIMPVLS